MKTYKEWSSLHLWKYLADFLSEWQMFHTNIVEKIKTHIENCAILWDNVEK
jgi:hypothetical protein